MILGPFFASVFHPFPIYKSPYHTTLPPKKKENNITNQKYKYIANQLADAKFLNTFFILPPHISCASVWVCGPSFFGSTAAVM